MMKTRLMHECDFSSARIDPVSAVRGPRRKIYAFFLALSFLMMFAAPPASACSNCSYWSQTNQDETQEVEDHIDDGSTGSQVPKMVEDVNDNTDQDFQDLQDWYVDELFLKDLLPHWVAMAEQLSATAIQQMQVIGTFLDAKEQLEVQRLIQTMAVNTRKDYVPSEGLCTVATMTRSLAGTERRVDLTAVILAERSRDRQLRNANAISSTGDESDRASRYLQFRKSYCDKKDNAGGLVPVCQHDPAISNDELNKDVDFYRTLGKPMTLSLDFASSGAGTATQDAANIFALESNLYAHDLPGAGQASKINDRKASAESFLDVRSIVAKRSVAENSFQAIAAMKSMGETGLNTRTADYMRAALQELGIPSADATRLIGDSPSYYAQMELLTKKIFQRPEFFVDLYDKPANIERKSVALQAISLMQRRDLFKSALRTESMLSVLLELDLMKAQNAVENNLGGIR